MIREVHYQAFRAVQDHVRSEFGGVQLADCGTICGIVAPPKGSVFEVEDSLEYCGNEPREQRLLPPGVYTVDKTWVGTSSHRVVLTGYTDDRRYFIVFGYFDHDPVMVDWRGVKKYKGGETGGSHQRRGQLKLKPESPCP